MSYIAEPLFELKAHRSKVTDPAYQISRDYALVIRDELIADFNKHAARCVICRDVDFIPLHRAAFITFCVEEKVCSRGNLLLLPFVEVERGLRTGYYSDREPPAPLRPSPHHQQALFPPC